MNIKISYKNSLSKRNSSNVVLFIDEKFNISSLKKLILHDDFINKIYSSKAVITDGGSIAEECSIMNLRTVIWRDVVENIEYLNNNMLLSKYKHDEIIYFLNEISDSNKISLDEISPSQQFVEQLMSI